ncbi:hypothetical protein FIBSPDRAFT_972262 [Athelia psychrophila]|uniref:DUF221-domain-containing protein n=1 Tax=Athelia psychrophila TaxID=1759441 RepID=A0A166UB06_9AGAM|nr:hypothetical protein FIBSPDRAFT_972262 [Fibularhizoctonia sp. CBS 109695]
MTDIQTRPFSKDYSGLINQTVIAVVIIGISFTVQEVMKRKRRGKYRGTPPEKVGSVESWEFGYLFQGRTWAKNPSPPAPKGWPLSWIVESLGFKEEQILDLRGLDATVYTRWLRACRWWILLHTVTTLPILLPIHVHFSENTISPASMTRASISSLVTTPEGKSLLWIHICLMFWVTFTWFGALIWICHGAFYFRALQIQAVAKRIEAAQPEDASPEYHPHPHPHPQYPFKDVPAPVRADRATQSLRLRTVMVENIPLALRSEAQLQEYFEYFMARPVSAPGVGLTTGMQPGFFNKLSSFFFNHSFKKPRPEDVIHEAEDGLKGRRESRVRLQDVPSVERVLVARKLTVLAAQLQRREDILRRLETAHIRLANKALVAVKLEMDTRAAASGKPGNARTSSQVSLATIRRQEMVRVESGLHDQHRTLDYAQRMDLLISTLGPYVSEFDVIVDGRIVRSGKAVVGTSKWALHKLHPGAGKGPAPVARKASAPPAGQTIWDALLSLPRDTLDPYQPLTKLSRRFNAPTVPSIDYYTAKLVLLTDRIHESRSKHPTEYEPVSTAFVTFSDPHDARRACRSLAVHPNNPLSCMVTMAPGFEDIDWYRVMKSTYKAEFVKDWVVDFGVWVFTIFWLFPVSLLVGLVSVQSIGQFWPGLAKYLSSHPWEEEIIQSLVPTILVSILTLCIPPIHLLIAKKAHTILTLSALHDKILTRYYKFLVCNIVIFFCVGTAAVQTILTSLKSAIGQGGILTVVATSFPTAGPFYVGWLIFTTAMHGGLEIALLYSKYMLNLPLIMYPSTKRQVTPRKRAVGIRPRTFNFYYWLPNHMLIMHIMLLFAVINPLVIPFGFIYFCVENAVVRNQLVHVYAKNYEGNGRLIIIRLIRYSCDGLMVSQVVFLAYMVVLKKTANVALSAVLIVITLAVKLSMTRLCRAQMEDDDIAEANVFCNLIKDDNNGTGDNADSTIGHPHNVDLRDGSGKRLTQRFRTLRLPAWINFSYSSVPQRVQAREPNPFGPHGHHRPSFSRLGSFTSADNGGQALAAAPDPRTPFQPDLPFPPSPCAHPVAEDTSSHLVSSHPATTTWDDNDFLNTSYDNPYYTKAISDTLWLPRDPFGILDLDETVDLKVSITADLKSGRLADAKTSSVSVESPKEQPMVTTEGAEDEHGPAAPISPSKQLTGNDIALPPGIASRVANLEQENDVEVAERPPGQRRPSMISRQRSHSTKDGENQNQQSTTELVRPRLGSHAWSSRSGGRDSHAPPSFLSASMSATGQRGRGASFGQASIAAGQGPAEASASNDISPASREQLPEAMRLVAEEEEREAAAEHQRAEKAEEGQRTGKKSMFTSWIYKRTTRTQ